MKQFFHYRNVLYILMSLIVIIFLDGCANFSTSTTTETQNQTPPVSDNQIIDIQKVCLSPQVLPYHQEAELDGVITVNFGIDGSDYFLDLHANISHPIPFSRSDYRLWGKRISPNGQWVAYEVDRIDINNNVIESKLEILDAYGVQKVTMAWDDKWGVIRKWLDNNRLFIDGKDSHLGTMYVINPFTRFVQEITPKFSNLYNDYPSAFWSVLPNSKLTLALYPNMSSPDERIGFNLWDIVENKKLWHQDSRIAPSTPPLWSPDETQFSVVVEKNIVENQAEIVILDSSGNLVLQTNLSSKYSLVYTGNYEAWSPNSRYLIFWLGIGSSDNPPHTTSLAMLDLKEKTVTDFCIKSYGMGNILTWAQDGKWLITYSDEATSNILVDVVKNKAYLFPIHVDGTIDGWMTKPNP